MEVPEQDKRIYKHVTLENGLETLLISDESAEKSAAAVSVAVGQLQDPADFPGMAHLVEHMLFMGTTDFPKENEYDSYLSQHGGHSNAFTDLELTCYFCDCHATALLGAMERFAACLTSPLLKADALEREIQAVDSEHANHKQSDYWRLHQLSRTVLAGGGNTDENKTKHPYASFGSGNVDVLLPNNTAENSDKEARIQALREQVVAFYKRYYKASQMKLVVLGQESVLVLQQMAQQTFGRIPTAPDGSVEHRPDPLPPLHHTPAVIHWIPVRECRALEFQWIFPSQRAVYQSKPGRYLSHLLGHEGPGSLLHWLRQKHWAQELSADDVSKTTSTFTVFVLQIELTQAGWEHMPEIVQAVYAYIRILQQGIPEWVHEELESTAALQFRFLSRQDSADTASDLAVHMQYYQPQHFWSGSYKIYDYQPDLIQECCACLRPDNCSVFLAAKDNKTDEQDPWYGTQYKQLAEHELQAWRDIEPVEFPELTLPERNDMLATDFEIISEQGFSSEPSCLIDDGICRLWYKPDTTFRMPKVNAMFLLRTPVVASSPRSAVLASLWTEVVHELCNEFSYAAFMAGLHCDFSASSAGVDITVSGYNHKAGVLLRRICQTILDMPSKVTADIFERIQKKLEQRYQAFMVSQPYQHAINAADLCLEAQKWSIQDRMESLGGLKVADLLYFHELLLERFCLESLIHGNVSALEAKNWTQILLDSFQPKQLLHRTALRVVSLSGNAVYSFPGLNKEESNNCILALFQIGPVPLRENAILSVLQHLLREPAFNTLRTEEQLGYIVHTGVKTNGERIKGLMVIIQGDTYDPVHMDQRVEVFLASFRNTLAKLTAEEFATHVRAVSRTFLEKNKNLMEESSKYWQVITNRSYHFTRLADLAAQAEKLSKQHVLCFFDKYFDLKSPQRRKLSVRVFGSGQTPRDNDDDDLTGQVITNPADFARAQSLFPVQDELDIAKFTSKAVASGTGASGSG